MKPSLKRSWLAALCLLMPAAALALSSDRDKPINITADRVNLQEKSGYSEYLGDVEMTQGSMVLKADRVLVYQRKGHLQRVRANGNPAHFSQQPDGNEARIHAQAHEIDYNPITGQLTLTGQARVVQGPNTFAGARIYYDSRRATVSASKGGAGEGRVHAIIQPPAKGGTKSRTDHKPERKRTP